MNTKNRRVIILILGLLSAIAPFSIDMYLPGFPAIAKSFNITTAQVTLSLSSFFIGISLGQIVYGPLLDRFGRKKPLYAGLLLYLIATAGCYFAPSIEILIGLRFIQAIGSCAAGVVSMAMVRDFFPPNENAKIFSLLLLVLGVSPMIAPSIGGIIVADFGWKAIFIALFLLVVIVLLIAYFFLPESRQADQSYTIKAKPILQGYWQILKNPQFITYAIGGSIAFSGLFAYISDSPVIFMEGYGISNKAYGWIFAILSIGLVGAGQFNRLFAKYFKPEEIVIGAISSMIIIGSILFSGLNQHWFGMIGTIVCIFLFLGCIGISNPNAAALSMAPFEKNAGSAASLFGFLQWGTAGLSSVVVSYFKSQTPIPLAVFMVGSALLAFVILYIGNRAIKNQEIRNSTPSF